jgi:hypothetical protein
MSDAKNPGSTKPPRRITLSIAAEELANELIALRIIAEKDSAKRAGKSIWRLLSVLSACSVMMRQHGDMFAAASAVSNVIEISGHSHGSPRSYDSAHRAAIGEAKHLLLGLWTYLAAADQSEPVAEYLKDIGELTESLLAMSEPAVRGSTPIRLSRQLICERWVEAKAEIQARLSSTWERDFRTVPAQITFERRRLRETRGKADDKESLRRQ